MNEELEKYFETNKDTWNQKVTIHKESDFYDVEAFLKGETTLNQIEIEELGAVKGKDLLHLQCHFGLDTLSFDRLGARCTGIDLSDEGIKEAQRLNKEIGGNSKFIATNVYDVSKNVPGDFDVVFTSYGVVGWLPDLDIWANIIAEKLRPGGVFYMAEFHPIVWMFEYLESPIKMKYPYLKGDVIYEEYEGTYGDNDSKMVSKEYGWNHGLGEVVTALTNAGLQIDFLHEHEESPYDCLPDMVQTENGGYVLKDYKGLFPMIYSIKATKK